MKHYKITKKTYYSINTNGELTEQVKFRPYKRKFWFFWEQLQTSSLYYDGSNPGCGRGVAYYYLLYLFIKQKLYENLN